MAENPNQPREYDAVLGGNNPPATVSTSSTEKQSSQSQTSSTGRQSSQPQASSTSVSTGATGKQSSQSQSSSTNFSGVETSEISAEGCLVFLKALVSIAGWVLVAVVVAGVLVVLGFLVIWLPLLALGVVGFLGPLYLIVWLMVKILKVTFNNT
jgi:cobalamin biosynthesis Mg chelatase CobN